MIRVQEAQRGRFSPCVREELGRGGGGRAWLVDIGQTDKAGLRRKIKYEGTEEPYLLCASLSTFAEP